jgi:hypothetical protein
MFWELTLSCHHMVACIVLSVIVLSLCFWYSISSSVNETENSVLLFCRAFVMVCYIPKQYFLFSLNFIRHWLIIEARFKSQLCFRDTVYCSEGSISEVCFPHLKTGIKWASEIVETFWPVTACGLVVSLLVFKAFNSDGWNKFSNVMHIIHNLPQHTIYNKTAL